MSARKARVSGALKSSLPSQIYRVIADTIPQMVWTAGADGLLDYVNKRVFDYTGKFAEELEGFGWRQLVHPQDWPFARARWEDAVRGGQPYESQHRLRRADGAYRWHLVAAQPLKEAGGRVMKWFGTCTDVEDQLRAAQVLSRRRDSRGGTQGVAQTRQTEEWLHSIMTLSSDFFWETDIEHRFTKLEPGGRFDTAMFVSTRIGKTRWDVPSMLPDAAEWRAHRETLAARKAFRDFEIVRKGDDGVVHYYSVDGEPMFGADGEFRGYRGVGRDITERKRAELALQESNRQFRAFLDCMPAVAWIKDARFRYVWVSGSFARAYGKSMQDVEGRDDFEIWPEPLARRFRSNDEKALWANGPVQSVDRVRYPDGRAARWSVVKFPMPYGGGAPGVAGIAFEAPVGEPVAGAAGEATQALVLERLSARERQVLRLIVDGHTSAEVAARLGLSPKSVDTYRSRLMAKLGIEGLPALVKFALRNGLTTI